MNNFFTNLFHSCFITESTVFRDMLFEVGENLTSQHVDTLADLAEFSVREKDDISRYTGNRPLYLFQLLQEKGKQNQSDVLWLHNNLIKIHNKMAAKIVSNYISGPGEWLFYFSPNCHNNGLFVDCFSHSNKF